MNVYAFLDLDDTLFQTLSKCPSEGPRHPAAFGRDGVPLSFMTDRQAKFLELLRAAGTIIPVTARSLDAFRRVKLPFRSLSILDFGGVILLHDGKLDTVWDAEIRPRATALAGRLEIILAETKEFSDRHGLGAQIRIIDDFGMPLYLVIKHPQGDTSVLDRLRAECLPALRLCEFFIHANGNNLSVVPHFLGKEQAVRHVLQHHLGDEPALTIGIADSVSDLPYLNLCDFMMTPRESQLANWIVERQFDR